MCKYTLGIAHFYNNRRNRAVGGEEDSFEVLLYSLHIDYLLTKTYY